MMRCAKIELALAAPAGDEAAGSSGTVGILSRGRGGSLGERVNSSDDGRVSGAPLDAASVAASAGDERGRGTAGRLPVADSDVLKAPVSLARASPIARRDSLPVRAAA